MRTKFFPRVLLYSLILLVLTGAVYFIFLRTTPKHAHISSEMAPAKSIAVLPFTNAANDSSQQYLSDGLTDDIINSLSQLNGVKVIGTASVFQFRNTKLSLREIGNRLHVNTVLQGSLALTGNSVRIIARLTNVEDSSDIWYKQFDENADAIFSMQDKIANAIAMRLQIDPEKNELPIQTHKNMSNPTAYKLYLRGRLAWNLKTPVSLKKGIDFFQQAIGLDSLYAPAYAGLADCYTALGYGSFITPTEAFPKAFAAANKAIALDATLAEPYATVGYYRFYYEWDWQAAEEGFRKAISLNPNYALAYDWYGYYLTSMKRYDEARAALDKAAELDPLSIAIKTDIGFSTYYNGQYDSAIKLLNDALQMNPVFPLAKLWMGRCYQAKKMYPEAIAEFRDAIKASSQWPVAYAQIGSVYGVAGNKEGALQILDTLSALAKNEYVTSYGVALVYAGLDNKEEAFHWLNKAYDERTNWLVWLNTDPRWVLMRPDKRFTELVAKVGLPR